MLSKRAPTCFTINCDRARDYMKKTILTIIFTVCFGSALSAQTTWLDRPITTNWNNGNGVVPTAPRETASSPNSAMCREQIRVADSLADRAVTRAGWFLFGPSYNYGTITIVTAMASVDGMCRPNQYNGFVFVSNRFAGTLSPTPTDARSDGALGDINFFNPDNLSVEFARYTDEDALCCPSRTSTVTYTITTGTRGLVAANDVDTVTVCRDGGGPIQTQDNVVSGTVTYRLRSALPPTAVLTVSLLDVSRADAPSTPIAQQRIETAGRQVPFSFDMAYDRTKIQERNRYSVRAEIRDGERLLFTTDTNYPVITQNNPRTVEIVVVPVGGAGRPNRGESSIRGTVTYRERIAFGAKSEVTVKLVDSATPDGTPVAETTFNTDGKQVPIAFELNYEQRDINRQRTYELQAEIRTDGQVRFRTVSGQPVTLRANQPTVELVLEPATDEPEPITGRTLSLSKFGAGTLQIEGRGTAVVFRGSVNVRTTGDADVTLNSTVFSGKLTFIDDTTARITITNSGDADASGEITVNYSGRSLRSITATNLVLDGQNVTLRF
jgi:uncharacterized lipoprotein YbaY